MRFAIPLCAFIFLAWPLILSYRMKSGFAEKQFSSSEKLFFSRMLGLLPNPPKTHMWVGLGTWNIVYPITRRKVPRRESRPAGLELPSFKSEVQHANHYATGALPSRNFIFSLSLFPLAAKGWVYHGFQLRKNNFSGSYFFFFSALFCETQTSPALQENNFSGSKKLFFSTLVFWNSEKLGFAKKNIFQAPFFFAHQPCKFIQAWLWKNVRL